MPQKKKKKKKKRRKTSHFLCAVCFHLLNVTESIKHMPKMFKTANFDFSCYSLTLATYVYMNNT